MRNIILLCFICLLSPKLAISEEPIVSWAGKMVIVSVPGNITHGDKMRFIFKEGRCHQVHHAFTIYTYVKESKLKHLENKTISLTLNNKKGRLLHRPFLEQLTVLHVEVLFYFTVNEFNVSHRFSITCTEARFKNT